jgi:hypothetical protein
VPNNGTARAGSVTVAALASQAGEAMMDAPERDDAIRRGRL